MQQRRATTMAAAALGLLLAAASGRAAGDSTGAAGAAAGAAEAASAPLSAPSPTGAAAEPLPLVEAVRLARRQSPVIAQSQAESEAAGAASREARRSRLPAVEFRETGIRTDSPADVFGLELMQERFSFPAFVSGDPNKPKALDDYSSQLEATLPVFTGGALQSGIRQAARMEDAAAATQAHTAAATDCAVASAYLDALLSDRFVALAAQARETTQRHVEKAQDLFHAGMIVESDLLEAEVQLAKMDAGLIEAQNGARLARAGLNRTMGVEQGRSFALEEPSALADSVPFGSEEACARALRARQDLRAADGRVQAAESGIGRAQADYWPQIGLSARYSWNDDRVLGGHGRSYTLAAMAQWQLWDWGLTRARVARSRSEYQAAVEGERSYRQQVEFEVRQAWQALAQARASHEVSLRAVRAAERALSILDDRFAQGLVHMTDLLDAETMADQARVQEAQTRFGVQKAIRNLRFAVGLPPIPEVQP